MKYRAHLRPVWFGAIGIALEAFFTWLAISILPTHNIHLGIRIASTLKIDVYGALIPIFVSVFFVLCLVYLLGFSPKQYFHYFRYSVLIIFAMSVATPLGVVGLTPLFGVLVGFLAGCIMFYKRRVREIWRLHDKRMFNITKRKYIIASFLATSYASLSALILDLFYFVFYLGLAALGLFTMSTFYIGGAGLVDGILMSGVFAALGVAIASLLTKAYIS